MASSTVVEYFLCHFCYKKFPDQSLLISHFPHCHSKNSTKRHDETTRLPRLNKNDREILHMLKLHRLNEKSVSYEPQYVSNSNLQIPLSSTHLIPSKQLSFDDSVCNASTTNEPTEQENLSNTLNLKPPSSYHLYKYSRREHKNFYASVKRARLKKHLIISKKSRTNSLIFNSKHFLINIPTIIKSRQKSNMNSNNSYPLLFDRNFNSLVQISTNNSLKNYFTNMNLYFHLIHSIASQEFQTIVYSNDNQHQLSFTAYSFINILRQTMLDYTINLQKNLKRNYFQSFQTDITSTKMPRYDQPSSSSRIHIEDNHHQPEILVERNLSSTPIINKCLPLDNNHEIIQPVQSIPILINHQQSINRPSTESSISTFLPVIEEQRSNRSPSPIILKEQKLEPIQYDEPNLSFERTPIHLINGNHLNKKSSTRQKSIKSMQNLDENSLEKPTRMSTRKTSIKIESVPILYPSFETKPVLLSPSQISKEWLTHTVFYRCHACSHEQFFVALSRECMNLHLSSEHSNMQENFKQRLSNFLTNKGRSLKIFQHYLKWQQPWSEKQIEQIFKLSNK